MKLLVMFKLRNVTIEDIKDIILINEDAIPAVNSVSYEEFLNFYEKKKLILKSLSTMIKLFVGFYLFCLLALIIRV